GVDDTHCRIFLTSTELSYWTAPEGWSNFGNKIEVIGAGGGGGASSGGLTGSMWKATGGGGGAYSAIRNFFVEEPGVTQVPYRVGAGGSGHTVSNIPLGQHPPGGLGGRTWFGSETFPGQGTDNTKAAAAGGSGGGVATSTPNLLGGGGGSALEGWGQV